MGNELLAWLGESTLVTSAAAILVLALRRPLRAACGATAAYALWALLPVALFALLLPAASVPAAPALIVAPVRVAVAPAAPAVATVAGSADALLAAWLAGALALALLQIARQRRFMASLGSLRQRDDGLLQSPLANAGLPAVLGWRARIVLPADFETRYDAHERELVLCHERMHQRRGDLPAAAFVALLRCLFWFNPLLHYAAAVFRDDQELACDAAVLRRFPRSRRHYGDALIKTQLADQRLPIGCHWFGSHPLKERITMLKHPVPAGFRRGFGLLLALALVVGGGAFAWAAQPPVPVPAGNIALALEVKIDGGAPMHASGMLTPAQPHDFQFRAGDQVWRIEATLSRRADGDYDLSSRIFRDGELVGEPRMQIDSKGGAAIGIGEETPDGAFKGISIELQATAGTTAAGTASPADSAVAPVADAGAGLAKPTYPADALAAGEGGVVMLELLVGADGRVHESRFHAEASTVPESSALVQSARETALRWQLQPATKDGKPVEGWVMVPVRFEADAAHAPVDGG